MYCVELLVDDGTNYATFSVVNKDIHNLIARSASSLLVDEVNSEVGNGLPRALEQVCGRAYVFHVIRRTNSGHVLAHFPCTKSAISLETSLSSTLPNNVLQWNFESTQATTLRTTHKVGH